MRKHEHGRNLIGSPVDPEKSPCYGESGQQKEAFRTHGIDKPCNGVKILNNYTKLPQGLRKTVKPYELVVYIYLLDNSFQWQRNYCIVSQRKISRECGIAEGTACNAIASLEKRKLIVSVRKKGDRMMYIVYLPEKCGFDAPAGAGKVVRSANQSAQEMQQPSSCGEYGDAGDEDWSSSNEALLDTPIDLLTDNSNKQDSILGNTFLDEEGQNRGRTKEVESGNPEKAKDGFERFWSVYPNKIGKLSARKAWDALNPSESVAGEIIEAVKRQQCWERWREEDGRFIPSPANWLKEARWKDVGSSMDERKWESIKQWGH